MLKTEIYNKKNYKQFKANKMYYKHISDKFILTIFS